MNFNLNRDRKQVFMRKQNIYKNKLLKITNKLHNCKNYINKE